MSAGGGFRKRFEQLADDLRSDPRIAIRRCDVPGPASAADLAAAATVLGGTLPESLERLYSQMNGFRLTWKLRSDDRGEDAGEQFADRGSIDLLPIAEVFKDWHGVTWFDSDDEPYRWVKPFDFFVEEACAALLARDGGAPQATVHYHYLGELLCDTGHGVDAFIDRLLASRGYWYWIEALCPQTHETPESRDFLERVPALFGDFDASLFVPANSSP